MDFYYYTTAYLLSYIRTSASIVNNHSIFSNVTSEGGACARLVQSSANERSSQWTWDFPRNHMIVTSQEFRTRRRGGFSCEGGIVLSLKRQRQRHSLYQVSWNVISKQL